MQNAHNSRWAALTGGLVQPLLGSYLLWAALASANAQTNQYSIVTSAHGGIGTLVQTSNGDIYGTTLGSVFRLSPAGALQTFFSFATGDQPGFGGLALGTNGVFYGTLYQGGGSIDGAIFQVDSNGTYNIVHALWSSQDGTIPAAGLVLGPDRRFYGTTDGGGPGGWGTIFAVTSSGGFQVLHSFAQPSNVGDRKASLLAAQDGALYGTTPAEGQGFGTIFRITPDGAFTNIYSFGGGAAGSTPVAGLVQADDGSLYGTTRDGGLGFGTIFRCTTNGTFTKLYSFHGAKDGAGPEAPLSLAGDGSLYGTCKNSGAAAYGTLFRITKDGAFTLLHSFLGGNDGGWPESSLLMTANGYLYGTTTGGGPSNAGVIFRVSVPLQPSVNISRDSQAITIRYSGTLYSAPEPNGPWTPVNGATNQYTITASEGKMFFRAGQN